MAAYYHLSVDVIGRSKGRSAVACAAYRSGTILRDERYGKVHDYEARRRIEATGIITPPAAPDWMLDRERLWNAVEAAEKRKDAQLSREFELAFPHQLDAEQREVLLQQFVTQEITSRGLVADWAIHGPNRAGDERNYHAHVMTTMRSANENGFDPLKDRELNKPAQLAEWRAAWADLQNRTFDRIGITDEDGQPMRVDHRSYEAQGIDQEPSIHMGVHATTMERRGLSTDLGEINREIQSRNREREVARQEAERLTGSELQANLFGGEGPEEQPELSANDNDRLNLNPRRAERLPANNDNFLAEEVQRLERLRNALERRREGEPSQQDHDHSPEP